MTGNRHDYQFVALWILRHRHADYDLCDDLAEAIEHAAGTDVHTDDIVLGVQFPDGRLLPAKQWAEYIQAADRLRAEARQTWQEQAQRTVRSCRDPFTGAHVFVDADEPAWIGVNP